MAQKPIAQQKFDEIVKNAFHESLKPLGFKKKGNSFFLEREEGYGSHINIQKNKHNLGEQVEFTINIGFYFSEFFKLFYPKLPVLPFPDEADCLIRYRIGDLMKKGDTWFELNDQTDVEQQVQKMKKLLKIYILPLIEKFPTAEDAMRGLAKGEITTYNNNVLEFLIHKNHKDYAQNVYIQKIKEKQLYLSKIKENIGHFKYMLERLKDYVQFGEKMGLVPPELKELKNY